VDKAILIAAGLTTALSAGLLFGFEVAVNRGLAALSDREYVRAMQSINRTIINPAFMLSFMGPLVLLPLAAWLVADARSILIGASLLYMIGVMGVTSAGNVPLNDKLSRANADESASTARQQFESPWNRLHHVRTFCAAVVVLLVFVAAMA
jgi:uncharacterized membrane protein